MEEKLISNMTTLTSVISLKERPKKQRVVLSFLFIVLLLFLVWYIGARIPTIGKLQSQVALLLDEIFHLEKELEEAPWETYINEEYGYEIKYPYVLSEAGESAINGKIMHKMWRKNPVEGEWEGLYVYVEESQYDSFESLWEDIETQSANQFSKVSGENCIGAFEKNQTPEGVKVFYSPLAACLAPCNTVNNEAIFIKNNLTYRVFYSCSPNLECEERFRKIVSSFKFLEQQKEEQSVVFEPEESPSPAPEIESQPLAPKPEPTPEPEPEATPEPREYKSAPIFSFVDLSNNILDNNTLTSIYKFAVKADEKSDIAIKQMKFDIEFMDFNGENHLELNSFDFYKGSNNINSSIAIRNRKGESVKDRLGLNEEDNELIVTFLKEEVIPAGQEFIYKVRAAMKDFGQGDKFSIDLRNDNDYEENYVYLRDENKDGIYGLSDSSSGNETAHNIIWSDISSDEHKYYNDSSDDWTNSFGLSNLPLNEEVWESNGRYPFRGGSFFTGGSTNGEEEEAFCGDGNLDEDEECDDGNNIDGDGCSAGCELEEEEPEPYCGDGNIDQGEACDDGNTSDGDGCSAICEIEGNNGPVCGNEVLETGEDCDNGENNGQVCSPDYGLTCSYCSNQCKTINLTGPYCGDNNLDQGEECDDGNTDNSDGCSAVCEIEEQAGEPLTISLSPENPDSHQVRAGATTSPILRNGALISEISHLFLAFEINNPNDKEVSIEKLGAAIEGTAKASDFGEVIWQADGKGLGVSYFSGTAQVGYGSSLELSPSLTIPANSKKTVEVFAFVVSDATEGATARFVMPVQEYYIKAAGFNFGGMPISGNTMTITKKNIELAFKPSAGYLNIGNFSTEDIKLTQISFGSDNNNDLLSYVEKDSYSLNCLNAGESESSALIDAHYNDIDGNRVFAFNPPITFQQGETYACSLSAKVKEEAPVDVVSIKFGNLSGYSLVSLSPVINPNSVDFKINITK